MAISICMPRGSILSIFHTLPRLSISSSTIVCTFSRSSVRGRPSLRLRAHCGDLPHSPVTLPGRLESCIEIVVATLGALLL